MPSQGSQEGVTSVLPSTVVAKQSHGHGGGEKLPFHKHVIAGAAAGLVEVLLMYPLDVVKTRLQLQKGTAKYTSVPQTFKVIIQEEGFSRLYRGIVSPILAEAPKRALKFSSNELYKDLLVDKKSGQLTYARAGVAGGLAGVTEALINCPFEVVKVRLQSTDSIDATMKIASQEGILSLYRGLEAQMIRNAAWNGTYFFVIPIVKGNMWKPESKAGFLGGSFATIFNTPMDVVKSRLQNVKGKNPWAFPMLLQIYREEGFRALYKGFVPRLYRLGPGGGIMLLAFDLVSSWMS